MRVELNSVERAAGEAAESFELGEPVLVCRWRMASRRVPMLNRHIRALSQRRIHGDPLTKNLVSWAKQHIEWALAEDASVDPDGVLMMVVDEQGRAAMSVGSYEPLADRSTPALSMRFASARREAAATGIAPEMLCCARSGELVVAAREDETLCGTMTFVRQLAETRGVRVCFEPDLVDVISDAAQVAFGLPFLASDEHGIVMPEPFARTAGEASQDAALARFFADSYEKLLAATK